jgi:hypothetical protein
LQLSKLFTLSALLFALLVSGQEKSFSWYTENFPKEQAVKLIDETNIIIEFDDEMGLKVSRRVNDEKLLLTNTAAGFSERSIVYNSFFEISEIEAAAYIPSGGKYKKRKIRDFREEKIMSDRVFHDDLKAVKFDYPDLRPGAKIDLNYTEDILNPFFLPPVYLQDVFFTEKIRVTLQVPSNVNIKINKYNLDNAKLNYTNEEKRGVVTHTWELDSVIQMSTEGGAPNPKYYVPHISFIIEGYEQQDGEVTVLKDVSDLYGWYNSLLDSVDNMLGDNLKETIDSISIAHPNELQKAQALFNWVRSSIKYVAVEDGLGGFIPDDPDAVSRKRFGDCKGMSCLLANMMRHAGLNARECWIGTRDIPYTYAENYTPFVDNHMITAYNYQGTWYFLDPTDEYVPFGYPSGFIQGKEALIGLGDGNFTVQNVPVVDAMHNRTTLVDTLHINDDELVGHATIEFMGYTSARFKRLYKRAEKKDRFFKYYLESGNDKFGMNGEPTLKLADTLSRVMYSYTLPDYLRTFDDRLLINLNTDRLLASSDIDERTLPLEREYAQSYSFTHYLVVPEGYEVLAVPRGFSYQSDLVDVDISYTQKQDLVVYHLEMVIKPILMQADEIDGWNKMVKRLRNTYRKNIELKKIN